MKDLGRVIQADNRGEGGIVALTVLILPGYCGTCVAFVRRAQQAHASFTAFKPVTWSLVLPATAAVLDVSVYRSARS